MTGKFKRKASRYGSQKEEEYWKPTVLCDGECPPQYALYFMLTTMSVQHIKVYDVDFAKTGRRLADCWYKKLKLLGYYIIYSNYLVITATRLALVNCRLISDAIMSGSTCVGVPGHKGISRAG